MVHILFKKSILILFFCVLIINVAYAATVDNVVLNDSIVDPVVFPDTIKITIDSIVTLGSDTPTACTAYQSTDNPTYNPGDIAIGSLDASTCDGELPLSPLADGNLYIVVKLTYLDISNVTRTAENFANITFDSANPVFINLTNKTIKNSESLEHNISVYDINGIRSLLVNDTTNFNITSSNNLVNITRLNAGIYTLNISIIDNAENSNSEIITITVLNPATVNFVILNDSITKSGTSIGLDSGVTLNGHTSTGCHSYLSVDNTYNQNDTDLGVSDSNSCDAVFTVPLVSDGDYFIISRLTYQAIDNITETASNFSSIKIDNTPPSFTNLTDKTIKNNESLSYDISTYDINGIANLSVNDTSKFNITSSGFLVNIANLSIGKYKLNLSLIDNAENLNSAVITISVIELNQTYADKQNVTVSNDTTEITVDSGSPVEKITIPKDVSSDKEINVSLASLLANGNVTLSNNFTLTRETNSYNYTAVIPSGTIIIGGPEWDGKINLPTSKSNSDYTAPSGSVDKSIEVGQKIELNFSRPVKVVLGGMAGKKTGWSRGNGNLKEIPTICNSATNPTNIDHKTTKECYIDSGNDLIIQSYHFTTFAAYTPESSSSSSSSGSGSSGGSVRSNIVIGKETIEEEVKAPVVETIKEIPKVAPEITPVIQQPVQEEQKGFFNSLTGAVTGIGTTEIIGSIIALSIVIIGVSGYMFVRRRKV